MDNITLYVRKDICTGCGECVQNCPNDAISLFRGQARIDNDRCDSCLVCRDVCPQGAIVEAVPVSAVSREELVATVSGLRQRADDLLARIDRLRQ